MKKISIIVFCLLITSCMSNNQTETSSQESGTEAVLSEIQNSEAVKSDNIVPVEYLPEDSQEVQSDTIVIADPSDENPTEADDSMSALD